MRRLITTAERRLSATMTGGSPDGVLSPIDLATTKKVLRFTSSSEDALLEGWSEAAVQYFEHATSRQVLAALWEVSLDAFPVDGVIELPHPPFLGLVSLASDSTAVDAATYTVVPQAVGSPAVVSDPFAPRAQIALNDSETWPDVTAQAGRVVVQFWAGYGYTAADVPQIVKACLYDLTRHFHSRPDGDLSLTLKALLRMFAQSAVPQIAMEREWT